MYIVSWKSKDAKRHYYIRRSEVDEDLSQSRKEGIDGLCQRCSVSIIASDSPYV